MTFEEWKKQFRANNKGKKALASLKSMHLSEDQLAALTYKVLFICYQAATYSAKQDINRRRRAFAKDIKNSPEVEKVKKLLARCPDDAQAVQALGALMPELDAFTERLQGSLLMPTKQTQNRQLDPQVNGLIFDLARTFRLATSGNKDTFLFPKRMPSFGRPCYTQIDFFVRAIFGLHDKDPFSSKSRLKDLLKRRPRSMPWQIARSS